MTDANRLLTERTGRPPSRAPAPPVPLRALGLPENVTAFVGRRAELTDGRRLLGRSRLVTVTGQGGVGKTRLAIELARSVSRIYRSRIGFVELASATSDAQVADFVATALGVQVSEASALSALAEHFADEKHLILLDNCEHVLDSCAQLISYLLATCPNLSFVTTSRETLKIEGEALLVLGGLQVPKPGAETARMWDSIALFLDGAGRIVPAYSPSDEDLTRIAEICRRLDGLPLAIELATGRLRVLSVEQILARLDDGYGILAEGRRDATDRLQTLWASIEWSYDLCGERERWLWRNLSVFVGGWDLETAEGVTDPSVIPRDEIVDVLQSLIEKSLVVRRTGYDSPWYDMVGPIRNFGLEAFASTEDRVAARGRHRDWYIQLLGLLEHDWIGPRQSHWLALFLRDLPNVRSALEFSLTEPGESERALELTTIGWRICWQAHGRMGELDGWLARSLAATSEPSATRAQALALHGLTSTVRGRGAARGALMLEARSLASALGDDPLTLALIDAYEAQSLDTADALSLYQRAIVGQAPFPHGIGRSNPSLRLALLYDRLGHPEESAALREKIIESASVTGESFECGLLLLALAATAAGRGDLAAAKRLGADALRLKTVESNPVGVANAEEVLAWVALRLGDAERAAILLGAARRIWQGSAGQGTTSPPLLENRDRINRSVRAALSERAFQRAFGVGLGMSLGDAVRFALDEPPTRASRRLPALQPSGATSPTRLSTRELEVVALIAEGLSDKQIASRLVIAKRTAEGHVHRILTKLGLDSRTQVAAWSRIAAENAENAESAETAESASPGAGGPR